MHNHGVHPAGTSHPRARFSVTGRRLPGLQRLIANVQLVHSPRHEDAVFWCVLSIASATIVEFGSNAVKQVS